MAATTKEDNNSSHRPWDSVAQAVNHSKVDMAVNPEEEVLVDSTHKADSKVDQEVEMTAEASEEAMIVEEEATSVETEASKEAWEAEEEDSTSLDPWAVKDSILEEEEEATIKTRKCQVSEETIKAMDKDSKAKEVAEVATVVDQVIWGKNLLTSVETT